MPIHNGTEWKSEKAWWVKVGGEWKKSTTIWKKVSGVWEKMTLSVAGLVSTFAGSGTAGDADGAGVLAEFNQPRGCVNVGGILYVCDKGNHTIRAVNLSTKNVSTFAGSGISGSANGVGVLAEFDGPEDICEHDGNLYITENFGNTVRKIEISTATVSTFSTGFNGPNGLCERSGSLYVCDAGNRKIKEISISTGIVSDYAGSGTFGNSNGVGVLAEFKIPVKIIYSNGFFYVSDGVDDKIRVIDESTGTVSDFVGSGSQGDNDGVGSLAEFNTPAGMVEDSGFIYLCDTNNDKIRVIEISTATVSTFVGSGTTGDTDGVGVLADFDTPAYLGFFNSFLYVSDTGNNKIRSVYTGES